MRLWKTPERLRRVALLLFLSNPILFFASLLQRRMPWWAWRPIEEWPFWLGVLLGTAFLVGAILRAQRWAYPLVALMSGLLTASSLLLSVHQENVGLGIFAVAFGILAFGYVDRLKAAFEIPAIDPGMKWFQSVPEPIPGVSVDWGTLRGLRLSQIGLEGGFILGAFSRGEEKKLPDEVILRYRGSKTGCKVRVLSALASKIDTSWTGIGVEFKNTDRDSRKELSDFIEVLRGEGHVST